MREREREERKGEKKQSRREYVIQYVCIHNIHLINAIPMKYNNRIHKMETKEWRRT